MKTDRTIFAIAFWVLILIWAPLALLNQDDDLSLEARTLLGWPEWNWDTAWEQHTYAATSAALEDRIPLRTTLVGFRSRLARAGLIPNPFDKVVFGQGDWLYVATSFDPHCPEPERVAIADRLDTVATLLADHGIELVIAMVPNKASIHQDGIPDWIRTEHDAAQVATSDMRSRLRDQGTWFLDLFPSMRAKQQSQPDVPLYYPTDTHWTIDGGSVFIEMLVNHLQPGLYNDSEIMLVQEVPANLDLDRLSGSSEQRLLRYYQAVRPGTDVVTETPGTTIPSTITTKTGNDERLIPGRTLLIRDSFWDHVVAVGREYFAELVSVHANDAMDVMALATEMARADTVIFETGERKFCEVMQSTIASDAFLEHLRAALARRDR
ncbi:MAG: hypothetical protein MK116_08820 [Phycisphaerales bacterium]|nr:hypothetical protein [Phycisphaerales bacterium]